MKPFFLGFEKRADLSKADVALGVGGSVALPVGMYTMLKSLKNQKRIRNAIEVNKPHKGLYESLLSINRNELDPKKNPWPMSDNYRRVVNDRISSSGAKIKHYTARENKLKAMLGKARNYGRAGMVASAAGALALGALAAKKYRESKAGATR